MLEFNFLIRRTSVFRQVAISVLAVTIGMLGVVLASPADAQDFYVGSSSIRMKKYSPAVMEEIKKRNHPKSVTLEKVSGEAELAEVVKWDWVESLEIRSENIEDIASVAKLKNLTRLRIGLKKSKENPTDLSALAGLTNLEIFDCYANPITKVEALAGLSKLKIAKLYMARVDSIDFLSGTPNLEELDLYGYQHKFDNYVPVSKLQKLKKLNVYMNKQAVDEKLAVLKSLTSLEEMRLSNCKQVTSFAFLENCKGLKKIEANWCKGLVDFSALNSLGQLEYISLTDGKFPNVEFLKGKQKLKYVSLNGTPITHVNELTGLAGLETVYLEGSEVTDITGLSDSPLLKFLAINKTKVADLSALANSEKLYVLSAKETQVSDLSPLKGKQALTNLFLNKTPVTDINPLADLPKLRYLDLTGTAVSDILVVATLAELSTLNLSGTKVTDFSPLFNELKNLGRITLPKSVTEEQVAELKEKRPKTKFQIEK